jgi:hypothetical protein
VLILLAIGLMAFYPGLRPESHRQKVLAVAMIGLWVLIAAIILPLFGQRTGRPLSWFECVVAADAMLEISCGMIHAFRWLVREAATFRF